MVNASKHYFFGTSKLTDSKTIDCQSKRPHLRELPPPSHGMSVTNPAAASSLTVSGGREWWVCFLTSLISMQISDSLNTPTIIVQVWSADTQSANSDATGSSDALVANYLQAMPALVREVQIPTARLCIDPMQSFYNSPSHSANASIIHKRAHL